MITSELLKIFESKIADLNLQINSFKSGEQTSSDIGRIQESLERLSEVINYELKNVLSDDEKFIILNFKFTLLGLNQKLRKLMPEKKEEASAHNAPKLDDFIIVEIINTRVSFENSVPIAWVNPRAQLTHAGTCAIADYYNQKYFKDDTRKIVVTTSIHDLKNKIADALHQAQDEENTRMIGFTLPSGEYDFIGTTPHPVSIILEKSGKDIRLYISDSVGFSNSKEVLIQLLKFCKEVGITAYITSEDLRQSDNGACRSEALVFLKNTLQLPTVRASIGAIQPVTEGELSYFTFHESADMLKTAQISQLISDRIEKPNQAYLYSTKSGKTFTEKLTPYNRQVPYLRLDTTTSHSAPNGKRQDIKYFPEKTYLQQKTMDHYFIIEQMLEDPDLTQDDVEQIKQRACSLPVIKAAEPVFLDNQNSFREQNQVLEQQPYTDNNSAFIMLEAESEAEADAIKEKSTFLSRNWLKLLGIFSLILIALAIALTLTAVGVLAPLGVGVLGFTVTTAIAFCIGLIVGFAIFGSKIAYDEYQYHLSQQNTDSNQITSNFEPSPHVQDLIHEINASVQEIDKTVNLIQPYVVNSNSEEATVNLTTCNL